MDTRRLPYVGDRGGVGVRPPALAFPIKAGFGRGFPGLIVWITAYHCRCLGDVRMWRNSFRECGVESH